MPADNTDNLAIKNLLCKFDDKKTIIFKSIDQYFSAISSIDNITYSQLINFISIFHKSIPVEMQSEINRYVNEQIRMRNLQLFQRYSTSPYIMTTEVYNYLQLFPEQIVCCTYHYPYTCFCCCYLNCPTDFNVFTT